MHIVVVKYQINLHSLQVYLVTFISTQDHTVAGQINIYDRNMSWYRLICGIIQRKDMQLYFGFNCFDIKILFLYLIHVERQKEMETVNTLTSQMILLKMIRMTLVSIIFRQFSRCFGLFDIAG
jgi:hypothetical protein